MALPNGPNSSLRYRATLSMCVCSRAVRTALSASLSVSQPPLAFLKSESGVWECHTSVWPYRRMWLSRAYCISASAWGFDVTNVPFASYQVSGFIWFSGVIWSKCLSSRSE